MYDLIIRQALSVDDSLGDQQIPHGQSRLIDVAIHDGNIVAIGTLPAKASAQQTLNLHGQVYLSAGWIDSHTHCYANSPLYHDEPDRVGVLAGVTTVVDAGSTGADDIDAFAGDIPRCRTRVQALINLSRIGLRRQNELAAQQDLDLPLLEAALQRHPQFIVGLKARMSASVVGSNGLWPLQQAKQLQRRYPHLPLMVHVGNTPPDLDEIVALLGQGDILTHCYNGKPNRILTVEGHVRPAVHAALLRGMLLDVGHGSASFSFHVAEQAIAQGLRPHIISSDIYCKNRLHGPVFGLAHIMSKFLLLGMSLPQVLACVTAHPAAALRLNDRGRLAPGMSADLTLFTLQQQPQQFEDCEQVCRQGDLLIRPLAAIVSGQCTLTDYGTQHHVFHEYTHA